MRIDVTIDDRRMALVRCAAQRLHETTTMQVRAPFLERVDNGEKLPFMHRLILFCAGEFPRGKVD
jgi:hypothetical protein